MSDNISIRLGRISSKDPRERSDADMAFLKWCTSGGNGPPPPDDTVPTFEILPEQPNSQQQRQQQPPKPSAKQLEDTFKLVAAKPADQRTPQENEFLLGIQAMYKQRKNMSTRNNNQAQQQQQQPQPQLSQAQFRDEPKPPPALAAMIQKRTQAKAKMQQKKRAAAQAKVQQARFYRQQLEKQELVKYATKTDEPDGETEFRSPSNFTPKGTPPIKPPRHAAPAKSSATNTNPFALPQSIDTKSQKTPLKSTGLTPNKPKTKTNAIVIVATKEQREHAEKSLQSAMSRRLGNNMMSSLATKDLESRLVACMQVGGDAELIGRAKKLLVAVRTTKKNEVRSNKKEVSASKYSGFHAAAISNDIAQEWESKHGHLIKEAERQRNLLDQHRNDETIRNRLETEEGQEEFFDFTTQTNPLKKAQSKAKSKEKQKKNSPRTKNSTSSAGNGSYTMNSNGTMELTKPSTTHSKNGISTSLVTDILNNIRDQEDEMTEKEAEEYMFGAGGIPRQDTDIINEREQEETEESEKNPEQTIDFFNGPPSTPPSTNMPSPLKQMKMEEKNNPASSSASPSSTSLISLTNTNDSDPDAWRKIPKFINSNKHKGDGDDDGEMSPYRSTLELATSSRYTSSKHTEMNADREAGVEATKLALQKLEDSKDEEGNMPEDTTLVSLDDELPAFMLLEDCWNSVQLARDTMDKINGSSPDDKKKSKKSSPLDKYKPKKRSPRSKFLRATEDSEERLVYSPWDNRTSGGYSGMQEDAKAMAIKEEFDNKVYSWKNEKSIDDRDAKERGQFADYMTQMFLSNKLDEMPGTDLIRSIRREVAIEIEKIDDHFGYMPQEKDKEKAKLLLYGDANAIENGGTGESGESGESSSDRDKEKENVITTSRTTGSILRGKHSGTAATGEGALNGTPWSCKVCSKKNDEKTNKCIVCGRLQSSGPIKVSKFMTQKIKGEKGLPSSSTKAMTRSERLDAAANRATTLPAGSARNAIKLRKKKNKKPPTFGGRYNGRSGQIGSIQRRAIGTHGPIDSISHL